MWSWTKCINGHLPFYESDDKKTKIYAVAAEWGANEEVIVKQVACDSEDCATRAMNQGRIMRANPHPNICECLDFVPERTEEGLLYVYIISRKMPKSFEQEIQERIKSRSPFPEDRLWTLATQLITAYAFLQELVPSTQNIAHRDIKPQNILLDAEGNVKVCDFGFAKVIDLAQEDMHTLLGTKPYFSPALRKAYFNGVHEFSQVQHNVFKSDVYSLGVSLAFATIFEIPKFLTKVNHLQEKINSRLNRVKNYSEKWVNLLRQMLAVEELPRPDFLTLLTTMGAPVQYADDEMFEQAAREIELLNPLQVTVKCGLGYVRVSPTRYEEVPCMISLNALKIDPNLAYLSTDIVAVIDESGSMAGGRMDMVQASLLKVIDLLGSRDRLCIVTFSDSAERKCRLTCCGEAGKEGLKNIVKELKAVNLTNISAGFAIGMEVLENRRMKNTGASILLFTDGQNSVGQNPFSTCLEKYRSVTDGKISIFAFGYGNDVDSKLLEALASEGKGVFYHIKEESQIQEAFGLAYGHMTSVVARNLRVKVTVNPGPVTCTIPQVYSKDGADFCSLPDILANQQKDMVFMLKAERKQLAKAVSFEPVTVTVSYEDNEGGEIQRSASMLVKFVPWVDTVPPTDSKVFRNWHRVKGADCLRTARQLADNKQFGEADDCLRHEIDLLQDSGYEAHEDIASVIRDLRTAREYVQSDTTWQQGGDPHFASISYSHYSQSASVLTQQYSSARQNLSVGLMTEEHARRIESIRISDP